MAEGRELGGRTHRAGDPTRLFFGREVVCDSFSEFRGFLVQIISQVRDLIFGQYNRSTTERIGLDDVASNFEKSCVNLFDSVRLTDKQVLRAAFELRTAVIVDSQILRVQIGAHRAIKDDDAFFKSVEKATGHF